MVKECGGTLMVGGDFYESLAEVLQDAVKRDKVSHHRVGSHEARPPHMLSCPPVYFCYSLKQHGALTRSHHLSQTSLQQDPGAHTVSFLYNLLGLRHFMTTKALSETERTKKEHPRFYTTQGSSALASLG